MSSPNITVHVKGGTTKVVTAPRLQVSGGGPSSNSFGVVNVATQNDITAVIPTDTLHVAAGTGILLTTNSVTSTLTIVASGGSATDQFARDQANTAFTKANTANVTGQAAFDHANSAYSNANTAIYTASQIRANISNTAPVNYDPSTGIISHALSGVVSTTYGNTTFVPTITVDDKGHITSVVNTAIALPPSTDEFARAQANAAYAQANTANVTGQAAFNQANTANVTGQAAFNQANTANTTGQAAFDKANTANTTGQAAFDKANAAIYTAAQIRANISNTAPINYDAPTGIISHALSGTTASGYGDAATVPKVVVDDKGHVTSVTNTAIAISAAAITSGTLGVARGGTGQTAITVNGSLLIGNTVSGGFDVNALTQGSGILITNDKGSVTIAATGGTAGNSFGRIAVAGQSNVIAHMANDVVNLVGGTGIALTTDISTNSVTITATGGSSIDQFARDHGNAAFNQANTANVTGQAAFDKANTANTTGQAAFDKANTANVTGQAAFDKANSAIYTAAQIRANISNAYPVFYNAATGVVSFVPATANGQTLIGNTVSGTFDVSTLSQGTGVTIVNGKGTITLSAADAFASQQANAAYAQANIATTNADAGFAKANSANVTGQAAFDKANSAIYTAAQIRANISNTAPVKYDPSTGIVSFVAASANGQTLIGNTVSGSFDVTTIAQTAPVIVVNGKGTITLSHASSGVAAAVYGNASIIPSITVDAFGHITGAVNTTVAISAAQITSGTLAVARGGTGQTAITVNGSLLIGNTVSGGFDVNALTQGTGILITNDKGSITIAATGGSAVDQYARDHSNGAFDKANTANTTADAAFNQANTANVTGQAAFDKANSAIYTAAQIRANISNAYPVYYNATTGVVSFVPATANGQTLIGNTVSGTFDVSVIAQTAPVIVVNGKGTVTLSHASSGVAAATYDGSNRVIGYTVDQFGHLTAASNVAIDQLPAAAITSGIISVARGGTGKDATGLANGQILIGNTVNTGFDLTTIAQSAPVIVTNDKGSITLSHARSGVTAATLGGSDRVIGYTVDANGHITATTNVAIALLDAGVIATGTLVVARGGTGQSAYTNGQILIGNTGSTGLDKATIAQSAPVIVTNLQGSITISHARSGVVAVDSYGSSAIIPVLAIDANGHITAAVNTAVAISAAAVTSGILAVARGGTGKDATGLTNGQILIGNTVNTGFDLAAITQTAPVIVSTDKGSIRLSHARSGVTATSYGSASLIPVITVDDNGHITSATTAAASGLPAATANGQLLVGNTVSSSFDVYTPAQSAPIIVTVGKGTIVYSHARSGVVAVDSYGSSAIIPVLAIDANGHITAAVNTAVAISAGAITSGTLLQGRGGTGFTGASANGQTLIGNTVSGGFDLATLTAGSGININNLKGSIEIVATGGSAIDQYARDKANGVVQTGFVTIVVAGQSDVVADSNTDTLTLVAGTGMTITTNAGTDTVTLAAGGGGVSLGLVVATCRGYAMP